MTPKTIFRLEPKRGDSLVVRSVGRKLTFSAVGFYEATDVELSEAQVHRLWRKLQRWLLEEV